MQPLAWLKKYVKRTFYALGVDIRKVTGDADHAMVKTATSSARSSLAGALQHAQRVGVSPATIVDVGAAYGLFTSECSTFFPNARYILIEPLEEYTTSLQETCKRRRQAEYVLAAAAERSGSVTINVHLDLVGSSLYREEDYSGVNGVVRVIPAVTLDEVCQTRNTTGPYLIKLDTQGAELKGLAGAERILQETDYLILEVSLFEFFKGGPLIDEVIVFMKQRGFVVYDMFDCQYRLLDGAMSQIDLAFVKEDGPLRRDHRYATNEQRKQHNLYFRRET